MINIIPFRKIQIFSNLRGLKKFLAFNEGDLKLVYWITPVFLYLLVTLLEGTTIILLIPLAKGVITMNFGFVRNLPAFKMLFPGLNPSSSLIFASLVVIIFTTSVLKNILQYAASLSIAFQIRRFTNIMRKVIFKRYLSFGKMFFDKNNIGYLQTVLVNFTAMVTNQLKGIELLLGSSFLLIIYIIMMFVISWKLALSIILLFPILNYAFQWLIKKIRKSSVSHAAYYGLLSNNISNILSCIPLVKLYSKEDSEMKHFSDLSTQIEKVEFSIDKKQNLINPMHETIILMAILFLISAMAFMVSKEKSGDIASFLVFFFLLKRSANSFSNLNSLKANLAIASGQIFALVSMLNDEDKFFIKEGNEEFTGFKDKVEIVHLKFSYIREIEVLKDITFDIRKGNKVAIVGPTGSGKTTLINLFLRFYDCPQDSILLDGKDIRTFTFKSLRNHMSLVSQDTLLFNDTIRNNITYGIGRKIQNEELIDVTKKSRMYDFIMKLPGGFDTSIGDKGIRLSGGEKQRLSIARAMLKNTEMLILDEATSSLDTKTERLIQEAIDEAMKNRTTIVIAHRLSTIKNADKIVVIENGYLMEQGSLGELLEKKGRFYAYWQEQKFY